MFQLFISITFIAVLHTIGEILYKKGSEKYFSERNRNSKHSILYYVKFFFQKVVLVSLIFSLIARILFAVVLQYENLNILPTMYLATVIVFGLIGGVIVFHESINKTQVFGIFLILIGILLIGGNGL